VPRIIARAACLCCLLLTQAGCALIPEVSHQPQFYNPFPQLNRVAVLPFFNLSDEPTLDTDKVALAYFNALQSTPGFEVMPLGVVTTKLQAHQVELNEATDFQELARLLGVDAVVVGAVTDFTPYYPPRMGLSVNWYAANPGFHPIPPGYGLPWGTAEEEYIPDSLVHEAEFALAREQLKTQTPEFNAAAIESSDPTVDDAPEVTPASATEPLAETTETPPGSPEPPVDAIVADATTGPPAWPDPRGFVPPPPSPTRPELLPQPAPVIEHTKLYNGHDEQFTAALANHYYFRDDARFGGWQGYLQRSDDFIRFCCYLHVSETLAARGGADKTRVVWRWPISRYEP